MARKNRRKKSNSKKAAASRKTISKVEGKVKRQMERPVPLAT